MQGKPPTRRVRLAYVVSHPIQYQAPLLRRLAQEPDVDLTVLFGSDLSTRGYRDEGFGVDVAWDTPAGGLSLPLSTRLAGQRDRVGHHAAQPQPAAGPAQRCGHPGL